MPERTVQANGISIWSEDFGEPDDPPVLLIAGASSQGVFWPEEFIDLLVDGGRYVIRFDQRDTGRSSLFDFSTTPYTAADMANDVVGLLDAYGLAKAHIVGLSMGGIIAQQVAIDHPDRVLTLTSIISTPAGAGIITAMLGQQQPDDLPPPSPRFLEVNKGRGQGAPATREERLEAAVNYARLSCGTVAPFDEEHARRRFDLAEDRAVDPAAAFNHIGVLATAFDRRDALRRVTAPTLVIHGTEDQSVPYPHGVATAEAVPEAKLYTITGLGHEFPPAVYKEVAEVILAHTS